MWSFSSSLAVNPAHVLVEKVNNPHGINSQETGTISIYVWYFVSLGEFNKVNCLHFPAENT